MGQPSSLLDRARLIGILSQILNIPILLELLFGLLLGLVLVVSVLGVGSFVVGVGGVGVVVGGASDEVDGVDRLDLRQGKDIRGPLADCRV